MTIDEARMDEFMTERMAFENTRARGIVREILNFGVNDRMILIIISSLAANLERVEHMKMITKCVREFESSETFLLDKIEESEKVGYVLGEDDEVVG